MKQDNKLHLGRDMGLAVNLKSRGKKKEFFEGWLLIV